MFTIGQKVVMIQPSEELLRELEGKTTAPKGANYPEVGGIYTIKTINHWPDGTLLTFYELDNSRFRLRHQHVEPGFDQRAFRPLCEPKAELPEVLTALLDPANHEALEPTSPARQKRRSSTAGAR